jgi:CRISPR-associated protein Csm4
MRLYEITLWPMGALGTPLMGDTLFGQFCWQAAYDPNLVDGGLVAQLSRYAEQPFAVFSSAFPCFRDHGRITYALKRPDLPLAWLAPLPESRWERLVHLKTMKKKAWLLLDEGLHLEVSRLVDDAELYDRLLREVPADLQRLCRRVDTLDNRKLMRSLSQPHNTINRQSLTTGKAPFAPYTQEVHFFLPGTELALFVLLNDAATDIQRVRLGLEKIGKTGFGRDASQGQGRFEVTGHRELSLPPVDGANALYTLAPCVPVAHSFAEAFFVPFVRFGKHGDRLATSSHPFKAPVVMTAPGAVFVPSDSRNLTKPYFGQAVTGVSKVQDTAVIQGYAPCLPFRLEVRHEHPH